jgi:hypothetical protein
MGKLLGHAAKNALSAFALRFRCAVNGAEVTGKGRLGPRGKEG